MFELDWVGFGTTEVFTGTEEGFADGTSVADLEDDGGGGTGFSTSSSSDHSSPLSSSLFSPAKANTPPTPRCLVLPATPNTPTLVEVKDAVDVFKVEEDDVLAFSPPPTVEVFILVFVVSFLCSSVLFVIPVALLTMDLKDRHGVLGCLLLPVGLLRCIDEFNSCGCSSLPFELLS